MSRYKRKAFVRCTAVLIVLLGCLVPGGTVAVAQ